ncbi:hypothetical protein NNC19_05065 [Clostridium sp. SHJSY1]|uniref:hypothetical protein n=1 Tax=Clostridium sp. SHJSY1 TaxID=2942483 RepID=UPI002874DD64|nr:hypothetical protein [Clostridium sp. SHJSY1]MDS0525043.1 hypothetical protein [Clostridium sp. SHJSY1]
MSKHRHKSSDSKNIGRNQFNSNINNNPFGISPQQLLGLLGGNIDMTGIGNMLSNMGKEGFDLNSINQQFNGMNNNFNGSNIMNDTDEGNRKYKNDNENNKEKHKENSLEELSGNEDDENIEFLRDLKKIVDSNKSEFIDKIIDLYNEGIFDDK